PHKAGTPKGQKVESDEPNAPKPVMKPTRKKNPDEERKGVYEEYMEGHPKFPRMYPLASVQDKTKLQSKREDIRAMKRMFDEGYNAVRLSGKKIRPKMVVINYVFILLSILKIIGTFAFFISQVLMYQLPIFNGENVSTDFLFRVMRNASALSMAFQVTLLIADGILIQQMCKQDTRSLVWMFGISSLLTIFILLLSGFQVSSFSNLTNLVSSLIGSYLAVSSHPLTSSSILFTQFECCGFDGPLNWHQEKVFEWESPITGSNLTLQQNFTWVEECSDQYNREKYDN
ncbi:hypothetical protein PFISCL1PPCAC_24062, partial [Pristionchus fissidentatus]